MCERSFFDEGTFVLLCLADFDALPLSLKISDFVLPLELLLSIEEECKLSLLVLLLLLIALSFGCLAFLLVAAVVLGNTIESRIVSAIICCGFLKAFLTLLFSTSSSECDEQEEFGLESSDEEREELDFLLLCDTRERLDEEEEEEDELESESELSLESSDEDLSDDDVESE